MEYLITPYCNFDLLPLVLKNPPQKLPKKFKSNNIAKNLYEYTVPVLKKQNNTTFNQICNIVSNHIKNQIEKYGINHNQSGLLSFSFDDRLLTLIQCFTKGYFK